MKLLVPTNNTQTFGLTNESKSVIAANGLAFKALSSTLYSRKAEAVLRELSTKVLLR